MQYQTMTGIRLEDLPAILDAELPAEAYTEVPGGANLTDIDPNYMRQVLNRTFGLCGLGWGYDYQSGDIRDHNTGDAGQRAHEGTVARLEFWYILVDEVGEQKRCFVPASGGSENRNASYALKGAITNAIGQAASNLGFQESVYLGHRSHKTMKPKAAPRPAAPTVKPAMPAPKPAPNGSKPAPALAATAVAEAEIDDLDAAPVAADPPAYIVPIGRHQGKTIAQAAADEAGWLDKAAGVSHEELRNAALAYKAWLDQQSV